MPWCGPLSNLLRNDGLQRIGRGVGGQADGGGGLLEREAMRDERAHIEPARKDQPGHFGLKREVGRVTAEQVFFVRADRGEVQGGRRAAARVRKEHELSAAAQRRQRLAHRVVGRNGDDGGVETAAAGRTLNRGRGGGGGNRPAPGGVL